MKELREVTEGVIICSDLGSRRGSEILWIEGPEEYGKMFAVLGGKMVRHLYIFKDTAL